jgi:hypothetical protein
MRLVIKVTPRPFYPRKRHDTLCIGGCTCPRAGLDGNALSGIRSPGLSARSESLLRLDYPGSLAERVENVNFDWAALTFTAVTVDSYFVVLRAVVHQMLLAFLKLLPRPSLSELNCSLLLSVNKSALLPVQKYLSLI